MAAIITGSDSGIGKATAVALARRGHDVGITYSRDEDGAKETADEIRAVGRRAEVRHLDLTETQTVQSAGEGLIGAPGGVEGLGDKARTGGGHPVLQLA